MPKAKGLTALHMHAVYGASSFLLLCVIRIILYKTKGDFTCKQLQGMSRTVWVPLSGWCGSFIRHSWYVWCTVLHIYIRELVHIVSSTSQRLSRHCSAHFPVKPPPPPSHLQELVQVATCFAFLLMSATVFTFRLMGRRPWCDILPQWCHVHSDQFSYTCRASPWAQSRVQGERGEHHHEHRVESKETIAMSAEISPWRQ